jgi:hypothetical protein
MSIRKTRPFYVNNKELYESYVQWYDAISDAEKSGKTEPPIPDKIVDAMIKISTKLSYKPNFINYSFRDEMIGDAQHDCIKFAKKFKLNRGIVPNPFSYITTICFNAFLRRIDMEKKQAYVKAKIISETPVHEFFESIDTDDTDLQQAFVEFINDNSDNLINNEPQALKRKRKKAQELLDALSLVDLTDEFIENSIEEFCDDDEIKNITKYNRVDLNDV